VPGSILTLEYLDEALAEAEEAARWYATRSPQTAAAFAGELDVAVSAIERAPALGRRTITAPADSCFAAFRTASSIGSSRRES
jgi:plasmid stabilization system protein ParE